MKVSCMIKNIEDRIYLEARYLINNLSTIRQVAKEFKVSKSTVHKDISYKLKDLNIDLYNQVKRVLDYNTKVRHIRGGESTRRKYIK